MDLVTQQLQERRERILEAARELIGERGYQALTMRDLAARCRVSVPTLYNQFGSKNALMSTAVELHLTGLLAGAQKAHTTGHEHLVAVVKLCSREMTRRADYHRALLGAFMELRDTAPTQATLAADLSAEIERALGTMRSRRQIAAWVDARVLAAQITRSCIASSVSWALGELDDAGLQASMVHAACSLSLSGARGAAREALEREARRAQTTLAAARTDDQPAAASVPSVSAGR